MSSNTNTKKVKTGGLVHPQLDDKGFRHRGITLREHYAGLAMQTLLQVAADRAGFMLSTSTMLDITKCANAMADAMIANKDA